MKPLGDLSEIMLSAIKNFMEYWEAQKKTFPTEIISKKGLLNRIRRNARTIYITAYFQANQDFAIEFTKNTFKQINNDLEELHNYLQNPT